MDKNSDLKAALKIQVFSWKKKSKSEAIKDVGLYEHVKITCTKGIVYKQAISILANAFEWKRLDTGTQLT